MRLALFALLIAAFSQAHSQPGVLVSPLPEGADSKRILELTREVLVARGWSLVPGDARTIDAKKDLSAMRVFVEGKELRFSDQSLGPKMRQRNREEGPHTAAVPQGEIDALRADLFAAFIDRPLTAGGAPAAVPGQVLIPIPAGADPQRVMEAAHNAFVGRRWVATRDVDGTLVARQRNLDVDATLRVFLANGALRFIDGTVVRNSGRKAQVPERWLTYIRTDLRYPIAQLAPREERKPAPPATARDSDAVERLRRLKALLDQGLISPSEYEAKRAEILKGL